MKKVVLLAPTPPPNGGIASWTVRMLNEGLPADWGITLVDEKIIGKRDMFDNNMKYNYLAEIKRCFLIWKNLFSALCKKENAVVHVCIPAATKPMLREAISLFITHMFRRPFIIHYRCTLPTCAVSERSRKLCYWLSKHSDHVMVLNQPSARFLSDANIEHYSVIPNFADGNEDIEKKKCNEKLKRIVYVGGVIPTKGCDTILEVAKEFPEIQFTLVGTIGMDVSHKPENVDCVGPKTKEEVKQYYYDSDVFIFLTRFTGEGFSNSLVESMQYGLPCIVTDWAANVDMIEDKGGISVPINDPTAVVEAIRKMQSVGVRQQMSEWNQKKVETAYSSEIVRAMYVKCYEDVVAAYHS